MTNKQHYIPWVLIFGAGTGVLSIIPIINWLNCLFCGWMLLGAMFAVKVIGDKANASIELGEGAIIGVLTGLVTGVIYGAVSALMVGAQAGQMQQIFSQLPGRNPMSGMGVGGLIMTMLCVGILLFPIFGALGGLIGAAVFKKNTPYGGPPPGGGGFGGPPQAGPPQAGPPQGGYGGPPQGGGGFGGPPQGGGGFGGPPQGGGGFGGPPQGGGGPMGPPT